MNTTADTVFFTRASAEPPSARAMELFAQMQEAIIKHTDSIFARLMIWQWVAAVAAAVVISPHTWAGTQSKIHIHVLAAIFLGGLITAVPVLMALRQRPGSSAR
jgi:hypothetical protein